MTIKEVSEKYQISADTLRYYERMGMIPAVPRSQSGIRIYGERECGWIELALCLRSAGISVNAMAEYVRLYQAGDSTFAARLQLLKQQQSKLLAQRASLDQALERLNHKIAHYENLEQEKNL